MRFGAELPPSCPPEEIASVARAIERAGFHHLWVRDMITVPFEAWTAATACALATRAIRVGIDVTNVYTRVPWITAHAAVTLNRLSGGRLDLGFGRGITAMLAMMGLKEEPGKLAEGLRTVRALTQNETSGKGKKAGIPIFVAATDEEEFRLAARLADGALTISAAEGFLREAKAWIEKEKRPPGMSPLQLLTWLPCSTAVEPIEEYLLRMESFIPRWFLSETTLEPKRAAVQKHRESLLVSGPEDLAKKARRLSRLGFSELILEYLTPADLSWLRKVIGRAGR